MLELLKKYNWTIDPKTGEYIRSNNFYKSKRVIKVTEVTDAQLTGPPPSEKQE